MLGHKNEGGERRSGKWKITHFYDVTWLIFETLCPATKTVDILGLRVGFISQNIRRTIFDIV